MTEYNDKNNIICPYCDEEDEDSWEVQYSDDEYECPFCNKKFELSVEHSISYSTKRMPCEKLNKEHEHEKEVKFAWIQKEQYAYPKDEWTPLPREEWKFREELTCKNCDETIMVQIPEEEFAKKYPYRYKDEVNK